MGVETVRVIYLLLKKCVGPTLVPYRTIRTRDSPTKQTDTLFPKHARTRFAIVFSARGRAAIKANVATRAIISDGVILAKTLARVGVAFFGMIVAFTEDTSDGE